MSSSTRSLAQFVAIAFGLFALACSGDFCQEATATVVEGTVKGSKQVTKGIVDGVEKGRKAGESVDGASIVTTMEELSNAGSIAVRSIEAAQPSGATIELAIDNAEQAPMRLTSMEYTVLDRDGFTVRLLRTEREKTVAPRAKDRLALHVDTAAEDVGAVRLWGEDVEIGDGALREAEPGAIADAGAD